jgi:GntR family transcriptional regulator, galactonate operon transcriptional repressor
VNGLGYPRRGLHGRVVSDLGLRIVAGAWPSGAPLPNEDELAAELGVSRTVVREAIKVLQAKGLVEVKPRTGTRVRARRSWHLLDADVVAWQFVDMERGEDLRELYEVRATIETAAARLAAERRTDEQLSEIEAHQRRIDAASAEPMALRAAELDFHDAVVDAAQNSLLSHVGAMIRVALEAAGDPPPAADGDEALLRTAVVAAIRARNPDASEAAMRSLVDVGWRRVVAADDRRANTPLREERA